MFDKDKFQILLDKVRDIFQIFTVVFRRNNGLHPGPVGCQNFFFQASYFQGPSLGTAPSGTWIWTSTFWKNFSCNPNSLQWARTYDIAACPDSFITSPNCPVNISCPFPGIGVTSI